jgi:hypothetical protein
MKFGCIAMALLALHARAWAADVTVYMKSEGVGTTYPAKKIASSIFHRVGITVAWKTGEPPAQAAAGLWLRVILAERTPEARLPGALAVSYPFAACTNSITVFQDRIREQARRADWEASLLAYVLVHEITHALQQVDRHSEEGVMKAFWTAKDRDDIFRGRMALLETDAQLLRHGMTGGCRRSRPVHWPVRITNFSPSGVTANAFRPE